MRNLANSFGVTIGWWTCVLGAVTGYSWAGPVVVGVHLAWHSYTSENTLRQLTFLGIAAVLGVLLDGLLYLTGTVTYPAYAASSWLVPLWMIALWPNFATALTTSLGFLRHNLVLSAALGAVAGPAAYWGGGSLGAIAVDGRYGYVAIGVVWSLVIPILAALAPRESAHEHHPVIHEATT